MNHSEEIYNHFYDNLPVMMHSIDTKGVIIKVNNKWLQTLGYNREEVLGRKSTDFLTKISREKAINEVLPEFMKTGHCENIYYEFVAKNGEILNILLSASSEKDENGEIVNSLAVLNNISTLTQVKSELALTVNKNEVLSLKNSEKSLMLKEIHHRVKNNMLTIKSLISLQKHRFKDPLIKQIFTECESRIIAMARMHEMISESKNLGELNCKIYITNLVEELTANLAVNVEIDLEIDIEEVKLGNSTIIAIGIIIAEIFSNIFKHAYINETKGTVCLSLKHKEGEKYILFASDDGVSFKDKGEESKSLGTMLIKAYVQQQHGHMQITNLNGTEINIEFENVIE